MIEFTYIRQYANFYGSKGRPSLFVKYVYTMLQEGRVMRELLVLKYQKVHPEALVQKESYEAQLWTRWTDQDAGLLPTLDQSEANQTVFQVSIRQSKIFKNSTLAVPMI